MPGGQLAAAATHANRLGVAATADRPGGRAGMHRTAASASGAGRAGRLVAALTQPATVVVALVDVVDPAAFGADLPGSGAGGGRVPGPGPSAGRAYSAVGDGDQSATWTGLLTAVGAVSLRRCRRPAGPAQPARLRGGAGQVNQPSAVSARPPSAAASAVLAQATGLDRIWEPRLGHIATGTQRQHDLGYAEAEQGVRQVHDRVRDVTGRLAQRIRVDAQVLPQVPRGSTVRTNLINRGPRSGPVDTQTANKQFGDLSRRQIVHSLGRQRVRLRQVGGPSSASAPAAPPCPAHPATPHDSRRSCGPESSPHGSRSGRSG